MQTPEREARVQRRRREPRQPSEPRRAENAGRSGLLDLQRSGGNRAVRHLLGGHASVQRAPAEAAGPKKAAGTITFGDDIGDADVASFRWLPAPGPPRKEVGVQDCAVTLPVRPPAFPRLMQAAVSGERFPEVRVVLPGMGLTLHEVVISSLQMQGADEEQVADVGLNFERLTHTS